MKLLLGPCLTTHLTGCQISSLDLKVLKVGWEIEEAALVASSLAHQVRSIFQFLPFLEISNPHFYFFTHYGCFEKEQGLLTLHPLKTPTKCYPSNTASYDISISKTYKYLRL